MKTALIKSAGCFLILVTACLLQANAQKDKSAEQAALQTNLNTRHFVFVAQTATPLRGGLQQLTSYYDLKVSNDSIVSNLPYFGRAYVAPMNPSESGLTFASTASGYQVKMKKKGTREISINTKANGDTQRMQLTIFSDGTATLRVSSNNRDPISFNGYIKEAGKK